MRTTFLALLAVSFVLSSCGSIRSENRELQMENAELKGKLFRFYRQRFEENEYDKLSEFQQQGYDWFCARYIVNGPHSACVYIINSSGVPETNELIRIKEESGKLAAEQWSQGYDMALKMVKGVYPTKRSD